jgi:hypothetical protein
MNRYQTPTALRRALEDRLMAEVRREGGDLQRMRRQVAFDRLLCRLFHDPEAPWLLKGGYVRVGSTNRQRTLRFVTVRSLSKSMIFIIIREGIITRVRFPSPAPLISNDLQISASKVQVNARFFRLQNKTFQATDFCKFSPRSQSIGNFASVIRSRENEAKGI